MNRGITDTPSQPRSIPIHHDSSRIQHDGCRGTTGLNRITTVSNPGRIVSIRSSTVVNRSAAVMNRSGTVDETCRHRRSIVGHSIDAGFSFFPSRWTPILPSSSNRDESWPESWMSDWGFIYVIVVNVVLLFHKKSHFSNIFCICFPK